MTVMGMHGWMRLRKGVSVALAALLLPTLTPGAFGLPCHHHARGESSAQEHGEHPSPMPGHDAHGSHADSHHTADSHGHTSHDGTGDAHGDECTCIGRCTFSGEGTPAANGAEFAPIRLVDARPDLPRPETRLITPTPFELPLANAPPRS